MAAHVQISWDASQSNPDQFAEILERHSFAILTDCPPTIADACARCADAATSFFDTHDDAAKRRAVSRVDGQKNGFRVNCNGRREQFHIRCEERVTDGTPNGSTGSAGIHLDTTSTARRRHCSFPQKGAYCFETQTWPAANHKLKDAAPPCAEALRGVAEFCVLAAFNRFKRLHPSTKREASMSSTPHLGDIGPSVLDCFRYHAGNIPGRGSSKSILLPEHADPGLVTVEPRASRPGLEVSDTASYRRPASPEEPPSRDDDPSDEAAATGRGLSNSSSGEKERAR